MGMSQTSGCASRRKLRCIRGAKNKENECPSGPMARIMHNILIASVKGGVGKSTVSVNLAWALKNMGYQVGLLDADITGPDIPKLMGIEDLRLRPGQME